MPVYLLFTNNAKQQQYQRHNGKQNDRCITQHVPECKRFIYVLGIMAAK